MTAVSPVTKAARQAQIADILTRARVRSQEELAELLAQRGVKVTQATLSRDLEELGLELEGRARRRRIRPWPSFASPSTGKPTRSTWIPRRRSFTSSATTSSFEDRSSAAVLASAAPARSSPGAARSDRA